ncbi:hypothetical protein [Pedobacter nanyangensis]|uniref:hypothetical protein n=1 Tax=Pedobacter nanyangensis TaxID=1562389 RepID=UPI000DE334A1|nr:hypothetical protein [Pedobacter nanyangensis]
MAENEKTSPRIASLASKFLKMENPKVMTDEMWNEIKSVIASAFTQVPDKPKTRLGDFSKVLPGKKEHEIFANQLLEGLNYLKKVEEEKKKHITLNPRLFTQMGKIGKK